MVWVLLVLLIIVIAVATLIVTNLLKQISILEKEVKKSSRVVDGVEQVYLFFLKLFTKTLADMEAIDDRGAFKSDDEVGYVFSALLEAIKQAKFQLENLKTPSDDDVDKN